MSTVPASQRTVLVTGGSTGIGRMIAEGFAAAGHSVFICARTAKTCEQAAKDIAEATGGSCIAITCDISTREGIAALHRELSARTDRLHCLVNNAGSVAVARLEDLGEEDWDRVVDINLKAVFFVIQKLLPLLRRAAAPEWPASIINIGSYGGLRIGARPNYAYLSAKAGMHHLTRALAKWLAREDINVNTIASGVFPSEITRANLSEAELAAMAAEIPKGRLGQPKDMIGLTRFLASDASAYLTGAVIPLDGGMQAA
jgi:NAD(P)-dependent dehydrogenase (short-subunit alcohol dehydrogenase family)